jgi:hypothetical protein
VKYRIVQFVLGFVICNLISGCSTTAHGSRESFPDGYVEVVPGGTGVIKVPEFSIEIPAGASLQRRETEADFTLYRVMMGKRLLVGLYVGSNPPASKMTRTGAVTSSPTMQSASARVHTFWNSRGLIRAEVLLDRGTQGMQFVNAWTTKLDEPLRSIAGQCLFSIKTLPEHNLLP